MTDGHYKASLEAAKSEMEELLAEQSAIEQRATFIETRLSVLRKTILSLGELLGEEFEPETIGITDAIRAALREVPVSDNGQRGYMSPVWVRNTLHQKGFPLTDYKNPLAVIHTTLKRLDDQQELESVVSKNKSYYRIRELDITDEDIPF